MKQKLKLMNLCTSSNCCLKEDILFLGAALLVWTTTPWTLPSNLSACVNSKLIYARFRQLSTNKIYIMLESRIETIFPADDYEILRTFAGKELKGLYYEPMFGYFSYLKPKAFLVVSDDYVTAESGESFSTLNIFLNSN